MKPTRSDLIYLAGLLDGEGCVGSYSKGVGTVTKRFEIAVKMTHEPTIDWLVVTFGGTKVSRKPQKSHWRPQYRWRMTDYEARASYTKVKPWLRIK